MPLTARLNLQVIDGINQAIAGIHRSDPGREVEIGGILLGTVSADGARPIVRIEGFDPLMSEHFRGSSYVLSDRDKKVLAKKLDWWSRQSGKEGLHPVGFFRSHTRRGLYLDNEDFGLFQHYFPEPASLFLLVRPAADAAGVGGFFFWQEGDMRRESSYQEFPFDSAVLPAATAEPVQEPPPPPLATAPLPPRPAPVSRKPAAWLQIAVPVVIGAVLGAVVFELTTHSPMVPAPVKTRPTPAKSAPPAPAVASVTVEKPSPLAPRTKTPAPAAVLQPPKPPASPTGSPSHADRTVVASASVPAAAPTPPSAVVEAPAPAPEPSPLAPITTPVRIERPRPAAVATVTVEPVSGSKLGRIVGHIPGFRRRSKGFVPARPIHQVAPSVPADERPARDVPVDLRVTVDPAGNVADVEQASHGANRELVRLASDAARSWQFVPARKDDETVTSQLILHFRFPGSAAAE